MTNQNSETKDKKQLSCKMFLHLAQYTVAKHARKNEQLSTESTNRAVLKSASIFL